MKDNPKVLFDYNKKQKDKDNKIGPFKIGEEYIWEGACLTQLTASGN